MTKKNYKKSIAIALSLASVISTNVHANGVNNIDEIKVPYSTNSNQILKGSSNMKVFNVGRYSYNNSTGSWLSSGKAYGTTTVTKNMGAPEAHGRLGAHCNLYNEITGKVVATKGWDYNTYSTHSFNVKTPNVSGNGHYYARGTTRVYNGNGYTTVGANQSPNVVIRELGIKIPKVELKERQELYNSKGMIPAVGLDNVEGYVVEADLYDFDSQPNTPEEAIKYTKTRTSRTIPLYSNDGETVIGKYKIG